MAKQNAIYSIITINVLILGTILLIHNAAYLTSELVPLPREPSDGKHKQVCQKSPVRPFVHVPKKLRF